MSRFPKAVLMLAYGTPESLDDLEAYLLDIRGGRQTRPELVAEIRHRYEQIGGKSPLSEVTREQAAAVAAVLAARGYPWPVHVAMRHWHPRIAAVIGELAAAGVDDVVAVVMAPHYSVISVDRYWQACEAARRELAPQMHISYIDYWSEQPRLIEAQVQVLRAALAGVPEPELPRTRALLTAHSLPLAGRGQDDPYEAQLRQNMLALRRSVPEVEISLAYQSAGAAPGEWLGPDIAEVLPQLAAAGVKYVVVSPIGFVCDHVEVLYDLDIEAKATAEALGMVLIRAETMSLRPTFIAAVADAVIERIEEH